MRDERKTADGPVCRITIMDHQNFLSRITGLLFAVSVCVLLASCADGRPAEAVQTDSVSETSCVPETVSPDSVSDCFLTATASAVNYASAETAAEDPALPDADTPLFRMAEASEASFPEPVFAQLADDVALAADSDAADITVVVLAVPDHEVPETRLFYQPPEREAALCRAGQERYLAERSEDARRRREIRKAERLAQEQAEEEARLAALQAGAPGYSEAFVRTLTKEEQAEARRFYEEGYVFYRQNWSVMDSQPYGDDGFGLCGCGPTCAAAIISNLAGVPVTPEDMRQYAIDHHCYLPTRGTTYDFMLSVPQSYGITVENLAPSDEAGVRKALREGKLVLATMGPGDFTLGAHYLLYRGITAEGKILIADSYSYDFSVKEWDYDDLYAQLKTGYWVYSAPEPAGK